MADPLTIRYNNPGAIEYKPFLAKYGATVGPNGRYAQFPDVASGYNAMEGLLNTYQTKHGLNTVEGIVNRWAPPNVDNNSTSTYSMKVAQRLGVDPKAPLDPSMTPKLAEAMAAYEAGRPVPRDAQSSSTPQTPQGAPAPMAAPALTSYDGPSPDDVAMQRKLAMSLMQQGTSAEPVGHWTQALARVLQGGVGGMYQDSARQGEKQGTQGIVDMLQGQQNPTPVQLLSNPWTREAGMKTLVQAAKGPEYGKQGTIVQDGQGNFYAVQFNDKGETKYHKLQAGGQSPTGVMSSESGMQMNGGQGAAPTALQPSKGTHKIGGTIYDTATGKPVANAEEAIAGGKKAEKVGESQGSFVASFPKLEAGYKAWDRQADLTTKIIDRAVQSIEIGGRKVAGIGSSLAVLPETDARKLRNDLETIKANIGFDKLQAMREASPTGGALGAVSDMENRLLQAVQGALDQGGDPEALKTNLKDIKQMLGSLRLEKQQAFSADVGRFGGAARPQGSPPGGGIPAPASGGWAIKPIGGQ